MSRNWGSRAAWLAGSALIVVAGLVVVYGVLALLTGGRESPWLLGGAVAGVLIAAAAAAVRYSDPRTSALMLVAATVLTMAVAILVAAVAGVLITGRLPRGQEQNAVLPALAGGVLGSLLLVWALPAVQSGLSTLTRSPRGRPEQVVRAFAERSSRGASEDDLLALADSLRRTMGVRAAEIWRVEGTDLRRVASSPQRDAISVGTTAIQRDSFARTDISGPAWLRLWVPELDAGRTTTHLRAVAAAHFGQLLGAVIVEKTDDEDFTAAEDRALTDLGHRLGTVLGNLELDSALRATLADLQQANENLQASRARLVEAADAERRRIERDLHDGAQQQLVAVAISLSLVRAQFEDDPKAADDLLENLAGQVRATIDQVRELAHGIYPPALATGGLHDALQVVAGRSPQAIALEADGLRRYAPGIETAVYFCCLEALQNAGKHAPDAAVTITISESAQRLEFRVHDDGRGFDPQTVQHGHGLENMADRVGALGGSVSWESAPGHGVTVSGWVPAREREAPR